MTRIVFPVHMVAALSVYFYAMSLTGDARAETIPIKETRTSTVRIVPVHVLGNQLGENVDVDLFQSRDDETNFAGRFHHGVASGILYGTYTARVHVRGFRTAERVVRVFQPNALVVVGLQIGLEGGPPTSDVSGRVHGGDETAGSVRIRASGVYSDDILDAEVHAGEFFLSGIPQGDYVLAVTQGGKVLVVRSIKVPSESPIVIEIGDSKPVTAKSGGKSNQ